MKSNKKNNTQENPTCIGTGLVALDVVISSDTSNATQFYSGGSCGNVIAILSYLGWNSYPIARLSNNVATDLLMQDFNKWGVKDDLLTFTSDGSTPIIIHRILKDKLGLPKHRFEFRNPEDGSYLPSYKPCLAKSVNAIVEKGIVPNVFYFDRINRASIDLAKAYKTQGAIIFFEPSNSKDVKGFKECIEIADVVKFSDDRISDYDQHFPIGTVPLEIQTLGQKGLKFRRKSAVKWTTLSGYSIDNVVDSAGAGDWCTSGIITSLFKSKRSVKSIPVEELKRALQFGQALGTLNCTFESARGLMYNINRNDLLLLINHIVSSGMKIIPQRSRPEIKYQSTSKAVKISSLFSHN